MTPAKSGGPKYVGERSGYITPTVSGTPTAVLTFLIKHGTRHLGVRGGGGGGGDGQIPSRRLNAPQTEWQLD